MQINAYELTADYIFLMFFRPFGNITLDKIFDKVVTVYNRSVDHFKLNILPANRTVKFASIGNNKTILWKFQCRFTKVTVNWTTIHFTFYDVNAVKIFPNFSRQVSECKNNLRRMNKMKEISLDVCKCDCISS